MVRTVATLQSHMAAVGRHKNIETDKPEGYFENKVVKKGR